MATLSEPAEIEGTKVTLDVNGQPFVVKGDVLVKPGFRAIYPYGLKKDEQLPALKEGEEVVFNGAEKTKKQTEPPARYSQIKLIQEMKGLVLAPNQRVILLLSACTPLNTFRTILLSLRSLALR